MEKILRSSGGVGMGVVFFIFGHNFEFFKIKKGGKPFIKGGGWAFARGAIFGEKPIFLNPGGGEKFNFFPFVYFFLVN